MSYNFFLINYPLPRDKKTSALMINELINLYHKEIVIPESRPAKLNDFVARLTKSYPCITKLADSELDQAVWADGPIENNIGKHVLGLSMVRMNPDVLQEASRLAREFDLSMYFPSEDEIIWPDQFG